MQPNQQLGVEMPNSTPNEQKIHIQALHQPDPDFYDQSDEIKNIVELIEYYLTFQCKNFGDFYLDAEGNGNIISQIHHILYDAEDDKKGRIQDVFDKYISDLAYYVYCNHDKNRWAREIYDATIDNII